MIPKSIFIISILKEIIKNGQRTANNEVHDTPSQFGKGHQYVLDYEPILQD